MTSGRDRAAWEARWDAVLREQPDVVASRPPSSHVVSDLAQERPGRALDAGCGHGAESLWLAVRGWQVTGVDFSASALRHAESAAAHIGPDVAARTEWRECDLARWTPPSASFDLVLSLYVHVDGPVQELVDRLATGVRPGGSLYVVGHRPVDPATGRPTPAVDQRQVSVEEALDALPPDAWEVVVAEERPRPQHGSGVDAVVHARRREVSARPVAGPG